MPKGKPIFRQKWHKFFLYRALFAFGCGLAGIAMTHVKAQMPLPKLSHAQDLPRLFFSPSERLGLQTPIVVPEPANSTTSTPPSESSTNPAELNQSWHLEAIVLQKNVHPKIRINGFFVPYPNFPFQLKTITSTSVIFVDPKKRLPDTKVFVGQTYQPGLVPSVIPHAIAFQSAQMRE